MSRATQFPRGLEISTQGSPHTPDLFTLSLLLARIKPKTTKTDFEPNNQKTPKIECREGVASFSALIESNQSKIRLKRLKLGKINVN